MANTRRKRKKYTSDQRNTILAAAQKDGLTALDVQKKFGVAPVTYYSWRKKTGAASRRRGGASSGRGRVVGGGDLTSQVRIEVRSKVREILPEIVRGEVSNYLNSLFGSGGRGRGRRRVNV
jgi:transposase-like protein